MNLPGPQNLAGTAWRTAVLLALMVPFSAPGIYAAEKADMVRGVFDSVASKYDVMNDLMSAGLHRLWKRYTIDQAAIKPGNVVLDLAGGTGDLACEFARKVGKDGHVVLADINAHCNLPTLCALGNGGNIGINKHGRKVVHT